MLSTLFTIIGAFTVGSWLYENLRTPVLLLLKSLTALLPLQTGKSLPEKYGPWAVITGGSDGIGKGYAYYLAKQGMKLVLVARNEQKLQKVADEIKAKYGVEIKILVADFSKGEPIFDKLRKELQSLEVGILVNNVGVSNERPSGVDSIEQKVLWDLINVNVGAATLLCNILIPSMKRRRRGLIINVSSMLSFVPTPYLTVYAATKAYLTSFSDGLREELAPYGIECQTVTPGTVHTNMTDYFTTSKNADTSLTMRLLLVDDYVRYAGFTIGKADITTGHWTHGVQVTFMKLLPAFLSLRMSTLMFSRLEKEFSNKNIKQN